MKNWTRQVALAKTSKAVSHARQTAIALPDNTAIMASAIVAKLAKNWRARKDWLAKSTKKVA